MRKVLAIAVTSFLIAGCSDQSKMQNACKGLTETLLTDPSSVKYNNVDIVESSISRSDLEIATSRRFSENSISPESKRYFDSIYETGTDLPTKYWVDMDYTADSYAGKSRSKVMCTFIVVSDRQKFLASFSFGGRDYFGGGLEALFMGKKLPGSLGGLFDLK